MFQIEKIFRHITVWTDTDAVLNSIQVCPSNLKDCLIFIYLFIWCWTCNTICKPGG